MDDQHNYGAPENGEDVGDEERLEKGTVKSEAGTERHAREGGRPVQNNENRAQK